MRRAMVGLSVVAVIALLGLSTANAAEELWIVRDGKLAEGLYLADMDPAKDPYWKGWVLCGGKTVDGLFAVEKRPKNNASFEPNKSALGDCEFRAVFSCTRGDAAGVTPAINITDRGSLQFSRDGSQVWLRTSKVALPLEGFVAPCPANAYDGTLHSLAVRRVGDRISFYYDDTQVNEQEIEPHVNLFTWFDALGSAPKIKSIRLTAEGLSDRLDTFSIAPLSMPTMFSDNAVLQRDMEVPVWGWARPETNVQVSIFDQTKETRAGQDGKWSDRLSPLKASTEPRS